MLLKLLILGKDPIRMQLVYLEWPLVCFLGTIIKHIIKALGLGRNCSARKSGSLAIYLHTVRPFQR